MEAAEELIHGAGRVIDTIGFWPSFHDAEVISFSVSRPLHHANSVTVARLCIHYREHEVVGAGTADFEYVCRKSSLIELIFSDLQDLSLEDFNQQNVLDSINFKRSQDSSIVAELVSIWGFGGVIRCTSVAVGEFTTF
ncbi:immunity 50 family protein [Pseudomonas frederiksbergensis]|nr:immunity 50 family protein [Pseudomonas frederiksbergensis]